jgi:polyhydroxyalkanoate synthase
MKKESTSTSASAPSLDRMVHAWSSHFTLGVSPASLMLAHLNWLVHLTFSPGKQVELIQKALLSCS